MADIFNAIFESLAGFMVLRHCTSIRRDKQAKGVSLLATCFFWLWGFWNIFYYPHLGQTWSFIGGLGVVAANTYYVYLLVKYRRDVGPAIIEALMSGQACIDESCVYKTVGGHVHHGEGTTFAPTQSVYPPEIELKAEQERHLRSLEECRRLGEENSELRQQLFGGKAKSVYSVEEFALVWCPEGESAEKFKGALLAFIAQQSQPDSSVAHELRCARMLLNESHADYRKLNERSIELEQAIRLLLTQKYGLKHAWASCDWRKCEEHGTYARGGNWGALEGKDGAVCPWCNADKLTEQYVSGSSRDAGEQGEGAGGDMKSGPVRTGSLPTSTTRQGEKP